MVTAFTKETVSPPYAAWATVSRYIDGLRERMPQRIDRSLMGNLSGSAQSQLTGALRFLGMVDSYGNPQACLREYAAAEGEERQRVLREILINAYGFLIGEWSDGFDLNSATQRQFDEKFKLSGLSGDTLRKAQSFFLNAAEAAGIPLSPYIKPNRRSTESSTSRTRTPAKPRKKTPPHDSASGDSSSASVPPPVVFPPQETSHPPSLRQMLVGKFPAFDPQWPAEVQIKWYEMFGRMWDQIEEANDEAEA